MTQRVLVVSATTLELLDTCQVKFDLAKNLGLSPINRDGANDEMDKGNLVHHALALHYQGVIDKHVPPMSQLEDEMRTLAVNRTDLTDSDVQKSITTVHKYFDHYVDDQWEPLAVERPFAVKLYESEEFVILFQGKIDLVVRTRSGQSMIVDHKTTSQKRYAHALHHQNLGYCFAGDAFHFCLNYIGFQNSRDINDKFHRDIVGYNRRQIHEWQLEAAALVLSAQAQFDQGWTRRNITNCWKYGRKCEFLRICESDPEDRERITKAFFTVRKGEGLWKRPDVSSSSSEQQ